MPELFFSILKTLISPIVKTIPWIFSNFKRPVIGYKKAPENLFEMIRPSISLDRVREILGTPHQIEQDQYRYVFSDVCVQIDFENKTVHSVSAGLTSVNWRKRFSIWPISNLTLGKTTFKSLVETEDHIEFDYSTKFYHFYVVKCYGHSGNYWRYALGILECAGIQHDKYHWSPTSDLRSDIPEKMVINWACVTKNETPPQFNYFGFYY